MTKTTFTYISTNRTLSTVFGHKYNHLANNSHLYIQQPHLHPHKLKQTHTRPACVAEVSNTSIANLFLLFASNIGDQNRSEKQQQSTPFVQILIEPPKYACRWTFLHLFLTEFPGQPASSIPLSFKGTSLLRFQWKITHRMLETDEEHD